ncbi:peptidoglycan-associated lipoprotein Pal [Sphingobium sufflavum]|uniref:peptidoglycan-associated lipoprotein Pal n=1 Tax=Sphingobium sufflavum TaxID=1129547 RepID=UPI001F1C9272|nr:peptidoglycan-associated lipoprotein Pal [Sphingobium sufflavum]MCE7796622.1 peptidoglycan-associated lipoprotein Pal [Sphingobium sufflavum]
MRTSATLMTLTAALALGACAKKAPQELPPPPVDQSAGTQTPPPSGPIPGSQQDFVATVTSDTVHFDTDQSDVRPEDYAILQSQARWLARYPAKRISIEGHADERGTRDYNLALGERRANAAKNYLASLGVDPSRMSTISYGKERPIALGSDPQSWAQNRRAVTVTVQ